MALNSTQKKFALAAIKEVRAEYATYLSDMEDLRKEGYGRSHCFHGTDLWVEWDPICGYCEDGTTLQQLALGRAKHRYEEVERKVKAYFDAATVFGNELTEPLCSNVNRLIDLYSTPRI